MTNSQIKITCSHCSESFPGVLNDLFDVCKTYAAECPICKEQTFFSGTGAIIDSNIPDNAVVIKYVATI